MGLAESMKKIRKLSKTELLKLPVRKWDTESTYPSIALVPTRKKHDSGYSIIAIVGLDSPGSSVQAGEIAAYCDDVFWVWLTDVGQLRTDCYYPGGILHFWGRKLEFKVGASLSSTDVVVQRVGGGE